MVELQDHAEGVVLPVRAQPGARQNAVRGERAGALCVAVTQVAEKGKANAAVIEVLAAALGLRKSQLELLSGETNPQKKFLVRGVDRTTLAAAIAAALDG
jgi:uncharacterized protein (TIGR00251 family)